MGQVTNSEEPQKDQSKRDSRWWEFYFVRYFVGTVAGALVILSLAKHTGPLIGYQTPVPGELQAVVASVATVLNVTLLAAAGLAFCYVASSPVLVFHAMRGRFLEKRSWSVWRLATTALFGVSSILLTAAQLIPLS